MILCFYLGNKPKVNYDFAVKVLSKSENFSKDKTLSFSFKACFFKHVFYYYDERISRLKMKISGYFLSHNYETFTLLSLFAIKGKHFCETKNKRI